MAKIVQVSPLARPLPTLGEIAGIKLGAVEAGIRYRDRTDLVMATFDAGTTVAGVFTTNKCPGAPIDWCRQALKSGTARALVVNAGNANVFTGRAGVQTTQITATAAAALVGCEQDDVFLASTGVIGEVLPVERITQALPNLHTTLRATGWEDAARGIMTTDTFPKAAVREIIVDGVAVRIQGIAKGSGMIAPDMATMLCFIGTDANITADALQSILARAIGPTFNATTVDSDTSTSDTVLVFATGKAGGRQITDAKTDTAQIFAEALESLLKELAILVVRDGEGATKLMTIRVTGAASDPSARKVAMAIANSPLVKTAIAGEDANWGRIVMAVGKAGEPADRDTLAVAIGNVWIARDGTVVNGYDEAPVVAHMKGQEIEIDVDLGIGEGKGHAWTCDLTHGYIDINGSYRS